MTLMVGQVPEVFTVVMLMIMHRVGGGGNPLDGGPEFSGIALRQCAVAAIPRVLPGDGLTRSDHFPHKCVVNRSSACVDAAMPSGREQE
ncbi:hypothetical protein ACQPZF_17745 [Actinosynnema sp. CS-041913]|uniref:hypothetical protein n=1 Tax=Actinosynnema sp. CS-041913 TaxID=3239917 RepID=UPI003D93A0FC